MRWGWGLFTEGTTVVAAMQEAMRAKQRALTYAKAKAEENRG